MLLYRPTITTRGRRVVMAGSAPAYRAMLLDDVVMGETIKLTTTDDSLTKVRNKTCRNVPQTVFGTYTSKIGEPGGDLNYDESIGVY